MAYTHPHDEVNFNNGYFHLSDKDITRSVAGNKFRRVIKVHVFNVESDELTQERTRKSGEFSSFALFLRGVVFLRNKFF